MNSIRRTLLLWLFVGLSAGLLLAGGLLYIQARKEANQIFDYQMKQVAASLPHQAFSPVAPNRPEQPDFENDIVIQIWDGQGLRIYHSHEPSSLPQRAELGFSNVATATGNWRVYSAQHGDTVVQVAQPTSARRAVAADMALKTVTPMFLLFPFLGALIWIGVGKGLQPVQRVAADVKARDAGSLAPVSDANLPEEIQPLTHALNGLLGRLDHAIHAQRAFVADAAHELKTPLTALKLQLQLVERAPDETERSVALAALKHGLERANRLVQQLLTLAQQEPGAAPAVRQPVELGALAREVVGTLSPAAAEKQIDLGLSSGVPAIVNADPDALRILLNNLVDNALRYTPDGGRVDVTVCKDASGCQVVVQDTGPGIPVADLERVFDRFYRIPGTWVEGSGLGLAIARQIADSNGARIVLRNTNPGLEVSVIFAKELRTAGA
ncbi:MAG: two-component sensor histidine kinase [Herminiimonas sp.]|nr:two-component sensor histidine kinase [Herminiimonas sp.]